MKRLIALALLLLVSVSCKALRPSGSITYRVSGSAKHVSLTYQNSSGGTSQQGATVPWSYERSASKGDFLYVSAQIDTSPDSGAITVTISKDGETLHSGTAIGFPNIATASGTY